MKTKLLIIGLLFMSAVSCTPEPAPQVDECEKVIGRGVMGDRCYLTLQSGRYVYPPCNSYNMGDTYCE